MTDNKPKLPLKKQLRAIVHVAKLSFQTAPGAVFFKLFGALLNAVLPLVTTFFAALTTTGLAEAYSGDPDAGGRVIVYVIITAILGLVMTIWTSIDQYVQAKMRYVVEAKVSDRMYEHFLQLDFWRYDDKATADLYDRASQFARFFAFVFDRIAGVISQLFAMVAGVVALLFVNGWLALFVALALIPGVYLQFKLSRVQIAHWNKNVEVRRARNMIEWRLLVPEHIAELRLYGVVRRLLDLRMKLRDTDEKQRIEFERKYIPLRLLADGIEAGAEVASLIWITLQIIARAQPVGQFLYVQQVVSRAMSGANGFVSQVSAIDEDIANLFDYEEFMELPERRGGDYELQHAPETIEFRDVSFQYPGDDMPDVLQEVSLTIRRNQHVAIVGENGAGKSTFIKLLTGLYSPSSGTILVGNRPLNTIDIASWHRQLAVLHQDFIKYYFANVRDNVKYGNVASDSGDAPVNAALIQSEAAEFVAKLPRQLENFVSNWMEGDDGHKGTDLSGGQWQRLALARNFYRQAPIIILDEPTSAIDALAEARIFERLFKEKDKTIITISHRLTTVEQADYIYMFENGRIVERGTHEELVKKHGRYWRMFKSQLRKSEF